MRSQLEEEVFGEVEFGEIVRRKKALRSGVSDRIGRGRRNEDAKKHLPDKVVLGAVGYMLDNYYKGKEGSINLNSLFKKQTLMSRTIFSGKCKKLWKSRMRIMDLGLR